MHVETYESEDGYTKSTQQTEKLMWCLIIIFHVIYRAVGFTSVSKVKLTSMELFESMSLLAPPLEFSDARHSFNPITT